MLLPVDMCDWLPEDHLVHFVLEAVESLEMSSFKVNHRGSGSRQYPPSMMLALLIYCYATGRFSSREIEQASYWDVAVRYLCAQTHPDHDTICTFRRENKDAFEKFFVHVLDVAARSKALKKLGTVSVDGTKIHANASKHSAMSHGHAQKLLEQLELEVKELVKKAEEADASGKPPVVNLSAEIVRREQRKAKIQEAVAAIEERNRQKVEEKKQAFEDKKQERQARRDRGEKVAGPEPREPDDKVDPSAQYNFTDPESRVMKSGSGKHFEQCYNAQAGVDTESMLIVGNYITPHGNDKQELLPNLKRIQAGGYEVKTVLADTGYYSDEAVKAAEKDGVEALIAVERGRHGRTLEQVLGEEKNKPLPPSATPKQIMAARIKSEEGARLYGLRKQTVEPVFGIIKQGMRFRQFLMRGQEKVAIEWNLVCTAYNLKRIFSLNNKQQKEAPALAEAAVLP